MTHLFTNQTLTLYKAAMPALATMALFATALITTGSAEAQPIGAGGQRLDGAWTIDLLGDPGSITVKTSGFFTLDGSMFINNAVPNVLPGMIVLHGTGVWARSGNRQFDLTWIYPVVSAVDGSYVGEFKDLARVHYNADGTLSGDSTFSYILVNGTTAFAGSQRIKLVRVAIESLP
jgi:hypothetical protein